MVATLRKDPPPDQLHRDLATLGRNAIERLVALESHNARMRQALMAARACIALERTALADAHMNPDTNRVDDEAVEALAEYDSTLASIDAALLT